MEKVVKAKSTSKVAKKVNVTVKPKAKNGLLQSLIEEDNISLTENGAKTFKSTLNSVLDLFAMGGALRTRGEQDIINLFVKANSEDSLLALKCLFHIRNVRGGMGERRTFRIVLKYLGDKYPEYVKKNIANVVLFGRFDDLFVLFGTKSEKLALDFISASLEDDLNKFDTNQKISLLAKWLPSENASSKETRANAKKIYSYLEVSPKLYRKTLSALRKGLNIVEVAMSSKDWSNIDYSKVSSKASLIYRKAFAKHDPTGYQSYLDAVSKGEKKINASTLFPYEIVEKVLYKGDNSQTVDLLWDALPNYLKGNERNILCVCDVSGSMSGLPMAVSISLGIYTSERNSGAFKDYFLTFSDNPQLNRIVGNNIREKINNLSRAHWGMSTNVQASFELILKHAIANKSPQSDLPEQVLIISDMEFNSCGKNTNLEEIQRKFKAAGYKTPNLVFWNVNSRNNNVPAKANERGVLLVSGCSPSVFKTLLSGQHYTPTDQMLETLNDPMYDSVKL